MEEPEENFASRAERGEGGIFMALLKRKVQNACEKQPHGNELEFSLKNIVRNGEKVGCSGFVRNKETGLIVYLNTEDLNRVIKALEQEPVLDKDCEHCSKTYGTLGCCDTVSNEWVYSCKEGQREYLLNKIRAEIEALPKTYPFRGQPYGLPRLPEPLHEDHESRRAGGTGGSPFNERGRI